MKKVISILLALVLVLSLTACGKQTADKQPEDTQKPDSVQKEENKEKEETKEQIPTEPAVAKTEIQVPGEQIFFYAPADWEVKDENLSRIVAKNEDCLVSVCYGWPSSEVDLVETITRLGKYFTKDASINSHGLIRNSNIEVTSSKSSTIAGYDCVVFTGVVNNDNKWNCHVYGYTFVVNNVELMVVGLVSTTEQDAQMIADINALTDQIAASVTTK